MSSRLLSIVIVVRCSRGERIGSIRPTCSSVSTDSSTGTGVSSCKVVVGNTGDVVRVTTCTCSVELRDESLSLSVCGRVGCGSVESLFDAA